MAEFMLNNQEIERAPISRSKHNINAIAIRITQKLGCVLSASSNTYICKVHRKLRMVNEKAYEPVLLSIGPYHHSKRVNSLQCMEEYKLRYLNELTERMERKRGILKVDLLNNCLSALEELEGEARAYYAETITLDSCDFLEMMLLDGCFIIELFCRGAWDDYQDAKKTDPLFKVGWIGYTLFTDLILIENQLPFFVLEKLWGTIGFVPDLPLLIFIALRFIPIYSHLPPDKCSSECQIALDSIHNLSAVLTSPTYLEFKVLDLRKVREIKHLLDLVHKFMLIEETLEVKQETNRGAEREDTVGIVKYLLDLVCKFKLNGKIEEAKQGANHDKRTKCPYSATKLSDFGVRFEATETGKFYDIKFEDGVLKIPSIQIQDNTEVIFRNLVAYEEHAYSNDVKYITDYFTFMDGLIDSPKDVELLRDKRIIDSMMGDDKVISSMFNRMVDNVMISPKSYYKETVCELTEYCKKRRHKWMASLKRNYLNTPWRILSIICSLYIAHCCSVTNSLYYSFLLLQLVGILVFANAFF